MAQVFVIVVRLALVGVVAACTSGPGDPTASAPCPDCGPGEARYALVAPHSASAGSAALAVRDGGFAYVAGDSAYVLDATLAVRHRHRFADTTAVALSVASFGDAIYVLEEDPRTPPHRTLFGLDASANELWTKPFGALAERPSIVADALGPYAAVSNAVDAFDRDGERRTTFAAARPLAALPPGGILTVENTGNATIVANLFPTGPPRWVRIWRIVGDVRGLDAAVSDTAIALVGEFTGTSLDLAGTPLPGIAPTTGFVAVLSLDGVLQWASALPRATAAPRIAITSDGQIVVGGSYADAGSDLGLPPADGFDAYVAIVDRNGLVRAAALGGPGDQGLGALRAGPDGTIAVTVASDPGGLVVGSQTFEHRGAADYVIELVP